jgi:hypothetical protein
MREAELQAVLETLLANEVVDLLTALWSRAAASVANYCACL